LLKRESLDGAAFNQLIGKNGRMEESLPTSVSLLPQD
jgi:hypothetical protein